MQEADLPLVDSDSIASALRTYLPELASEETRTHLQNKLVLDVAEARRLAVEESEVPPPPAYDPQVDLEGRFADYSAYFVRLWAEKRLEKVASSPAVATGSRLAHDFVAGQAEAVSMLMIRTLLEELHQHRSQGRLRGDSPEERYRSFREWTNSSGGHAHLVSRYPILFGAVRRSVESAAAHLELIVAEVERTLDRLAAQVQEMSPEAKILAVGLGGGDTHNGGKTVAEVTFTDGTRIHYKPRPMAAEAGYHRFVEWLNERAGTDLCVLTVVPTEAGGFVEHVPTEAFSGDPEAYFAQIGQLAGVLYLLKAADIHYENVITCRRGPVVVDAETLLTPRLRLGRKEPGQWPTAFRMIQESAVGIGILPLVMKSKASDRGMDVGVIGYEAGQRSPFKMFSLRNPGRDDMSIKLVEEELTSVNANLSVEASPGVTVRAQRDIIKREFRRILEFARSRPDEVVNAVEERLGSALFRHVTNATVYYAQLLRMATHPDAMADPVVRATVLNRVALLGSPPEVADEEARQLSRGDVPYFCYSAQSAELSTAEGPVLADAFEEPAMQTVRARIMGFSEETIAHELRMIDLSFVNKLSLSAEPTGFTAVGRQQAAAVTHRRMLREAARIGDWLLATMIDDDTRAQPATWIAPQIVVTSEESQWTPGALGVDIYAGTSGVALALAGLANETGDSRYADAVSRIIDPIEEGLQSGELRRVPLARGGMGGLAGVVYAIATARRLLGRPGAVSVGELATHLAKAVSESDAGDRGVDPEEAGLDFVSGLAGTLAVCVALHRRADGHTDQVEVAQAARDVGAAVLRELRAADPGAGQVVTYTGFAHGTSGIAAALLEYGAELGDAEAHRRGAELISATLDTYDEESRDWPRTWDGEEPSYGWCHGAPGILLGCLAGVRHASSHVPADRLERLAELTLSRGFGNNPSYCHGDLGSADIVALAAREAPGLIAGQVSTTLYPRLFEAVLERYEERTDTRYGYSNSLMLGLTGTLWSILRFLAPDVYPSVLRFD